MGLCACGAHLLDISFEVHPLGAGEAKSRRPPLNLPAPLIFAGFVAERVDA